VYLPSSVETLTPQPFPSPVESMISLDVFDKRHGEVRCLVDLSIDDYDKPVVLFPLSMNASASQNPNRNIVASAMPAVKLFRIHELQGSFVKKQTSRGTIPSQVSLAERPRLIATPPSASWRTSHPVAQEVLAVILTSCSATQELMAGTSSTGRVIDLS
jgi:hypothetical protein